MAVNRVVYDGKVLMDLTQDTITPQTLSEGVTAHDKTGVQITGTMKAGGNFGFPSQEMSAAKATIDPNVFYIWGSIPKLTITFGAETPGVVNMFFFRFTSGTTATKLTMPATVKWVTPLKIDPNKTYEISIINNIGGLISV